MSDGIATVIGILVLLLLDAIAALPDSPPPSKGTYDGWDDWGRLVSVGADLDALPCGRPFGCDHDAKPRPL